MPLSLKRILLLSAISFAGFFLIGLVFHHRPVHYPRLLCIAALKGLAQGLVMAYIPAITRKFSKKKTA